MGASSENVSVAEMQQHRAHKEQLKAEIEAQIKAQAPLKWINRVILWIAQKMPSIGDDVPNHEKMEAPALLDEALQRNTEVLQNKAARAQLLAAMVAAEPAPSAADAPKRRANLKKEAKAAK